MISRVVTAFLALTSLTTSPQIKAAPEQMEVHFFDEDGIERGNGAVHMDPEISEQIQIGRQPFESNLILDSIGFTISGREGGVARYTVDDVAEPLYFWLETPEKTLGWTDGQTEFSNQWQFGYNENRNLTMDFDSDRKGGSWSHHTINLAGFLQTGGGRFTIATAVPYGTEITPIARQEKKGSGSLGPLTIILSLFSGLAASAPKKN